MAKVLVTGSTGFIGKHLMAALKEAQIEAHPYTKNLLLDDNLQQDIVENKYTHIVHLAANPNGNAGYSSYLDNVHMTRKLALATPGNCEIVYSSSITVYNQSPNDVNCNILPSTYYSMSKLHSEHILQLHQTLNENPYSLKIFRLCAVVGPKMTHGFLRDLFIKLSSDSDTITLFGNKPGTIKPYIHVDTVTRRIVEHIKFKGIFRCKGIEDLSASTELSIESIARYVMLMTKREKDIIWDSSKVWKGDSNLRSFGMKYVGNINSQIEITKALYDNKELFSDLC